ncbi:MAG: hypothetical protein KDC38_03880 [Planctomycetes bacterium]|nr:hypothetical protein [Planctomycetota bacterium]
MTPAPRSTASPSPGSAGRRDRALGFITAATLALLSLAGCRTHPAPLSVTVVPAQKDVLHVQVQLAEPLEPLEYVRDSGDRLKGIEPREVSAAPLYEVHYSYYVDRHLVAYVSYRTNLEGELTHQRTLIQPDDPLAWAEESSIPGGSLELRR